ncbi:Hypothetical protein DPCES_1634 [Desulfitobacterium hafniense]|uniref:Uncharacterized protein n=1 Tax=Desulfitobacterium hafniense TaxID=49338 RepID=A0A098B0X8_DESHA|nr:hypothetical protein [Desulfitobacterium hafniense]CDX01521.1 Hypothetical protein DPCES_1634 [Desulfitobacterium hafniense]
MSTRTLEDVAEYVEWQSQYKCKVLSAKPEHTFEDLGSEVKVWNVKTDVDGDWWVVEGEETPMNLYPQSAYYFSADEVYSFHMGLMGRMKNSSFNPEGFIKGLAQGTEIVPQLYRKLKMVSKLLDEANEIEHFQSIGVQCREALIELANAIYEPEMCKEGEQPKGSDFKKKGELFISHYLSGSDNADYRTYIKKMSEATWDYANKLTHSSTATMYEASTCVTLCISLITVYENVRAKIFDPFSKLSCNTCKSKSLTVVGDKVNDENILTEITFECQECENIMTIQLE